MPHILVTNDHGVQTPGLLALAREIRKLGKVTVFAPDRNWSASGHVKTMERPLRVRETTLADGSPAFMSDGAPSDCVALPLLGPDRRAWLADALRLVHPGHAWIDLVAATPAAPALPQPKPSGG